MISIDVPEATQYTGLIQTRAMSSIKMNRMGRPDGVNRTKMVGSVVHKALSQILQHDICDPRVGRTTITEVELSNDLKHVKVYLTSIESQEVLKSSVDQLNRAKAYIRRCLKAHLDLRFTPSIRFLVDELPSRTSRVLHLIDEASTSDHKDQ